jgi:nitric oxide reductase NorE protein
MNAAIDARAAAPRVPGQPDMWAFVLFEALIFSAYFVTYMVCRAQDLPHYLAAQARLSQGFGVANTIILLTSSWCMAHGVWSARERRYDAAAAQVLFTAACGLLFVALKLVEWKQKLGEGFAPTTNEFFSFYFFLTGIHVVHILIGFLFLGFALRELRSPQRRSQVLVETCATYWHMVDFLWVFIFALVYVLR